MQPTPVTFGRRSLPMKLQERRGYAVRPLKARMGLAGARAVEHAGISEQTLRTFRKISDPKNAQLFTVHAALAAFAAAEGWDD